MTEWSKLPNSKHIDEVIAFMSGNAAILDVAAGAAAARAAATEAAMDAVWDAARAAATEPAMDAVRDAVRDAVSTAVWAAAWAAAWDAVLALIAYDDADKYLYMSYDELRVWAELSQDPAAILLLPHVKAKELIAVPA